MRERYRPGEIVLLEFPHTDGVGLSRRPALVLIDSGDADIVIARVTRQAPRDQFDIEINDWGPAGLLHPSFVRPHKLATYLKRRVERILGEISEADWNRVRQSIRRLWVNV